jgi:hypothetical protein
MDTSTVDVIHPGVRFAGWLVGWPAGQPIDQTAYRAITAR